MNNEVLYLLQKGDVRSRAREIGINPDLFDDRHWHVIKRGIESGLGSDIDVVFDAAIRGAVQEYPIGSQGNPQNPKYDIVLTTQEAVRGFSGMLMRQGIPANEINVETVKGQFGITVPQRYKQVLVDAWSEYWQSIKKQHRF